MDPYCANTVPWRRSASGGNSGPATPVNYQSQAIASPPVSSPSYNYHWPTPPNFTPPTPVYGYQGGVTPSSPRPYVPPTFSPANTPPQPSFSPVQPPIFPIANTVPVSHPTASPPTPPPPPPPPPPPMPNPASAVPWRLKRQVNGGESSPNYGRQQYDPNDQTANLPPALHNTLMSKDKKPFTYTPGGLDFSELRSPMMQRRLAGGANNSADPQSSYNSDNSRMQGSQAERGSEEAPSRDANQSGPGPGPDPRALRSPQEEQRYRATNYTEPRHRMQADPSEDRPFTYGQPTKGNPAVDGEYIGYEQGQSGEIDPRYRGAHIPSRSFRILQEMTGGPEQQEEHQQSQGRKVIAGGVPMFGPPGSEFTASGPTVPASQQPAEAEPKKYMGGHIPSRSFRILQAMTGPDDEQPMEDHQTPSHQEDAEHAPVEPRMYMGGNIPSRSFRILQAMTGDASVANGEHGVTDF